MTGGKPRIEVLRPPGFNGLELQVGTAVTRSVPRHWHDEYHLSAHVAGAGELSYRGTSYANPVGSLNLVEPGEVHSNVVRHAAGCDFLVLNFESAWFRRASHAMASGTRDPAFSRPTIHDRETFRSFVRLHGLLTGPAGPLEREIELLRFLVLLLERHTRARPTLAPIHREVRAVTQVRDYLAQNYAQPVRLSQLSALTNLSPFHLTRVFTRDVGMPPHAFLKQLRISRAKALLRKRLPISHVAADTGFSDQSHLTRTFMEIVGVSPGAYRRRSGLI
jgi:AraC-like DNA-binding protein